MRKIILLAMLFIATMANCQVEKIIGCWTTIDDKENIPVSIVNIYKGTDGKYYGQITDKSNAFSSKAKKTNSAPNAKAHSTTNQS
jgi:hypothetical protein